MAAHTGVHDPLSSMAFEEGEEAGSDEDVPINDEEGYPGPSSTAPPLHASTEDPLAKPAADDFHATRNEATMSYGQLVGPPALEDADVFPASATAEAGPAVGGPGRGTPADEALKVSVGDPIKKVEQSLIPGVSGGYITYRVSTTTSLPGFAHPQVAVRRRFRDFVALGDLLKATHRGYFIPPRPEKNPVETQRASAEFVDARRAALESYLRQLAQHPVISRSEELRVFLEAEGPLASSLAWAQLQPLSASFLEGVARLPKQLIGSDRTIPAPAEAAQPTSKTGDLLRRLKELGQSVRNDYKEPPVLSDTETRLRNEKLAVEEFQDVVVNASRKAERLVGRLEEVGSALGDLGLALVKLAKFEEEDGARTAPYSNSTAAASSMASHCKRVGMASVRLSRLSRQATSETTHSLVPLHTHLALFPAVGKALREREAALLTVQALSDELSQKRSAATALGEPGDAARAKRLAALQADIASLEAALMAARAEHEKVSERNVQEMERWRTERAVDFREMLANFAGLELAYQQRCGMVWRQIAEELGATKDELAPLATN